DVFRKDVQSFRRDDHLLLAALDEDAPLRVALSDVPGVKPPFGVEDDVRLGFGIWDLGFGIFVIAAGDVFSAHENLAVVSDTDFNAFDWGADRSFARSEGMVQRDDGSGFRQSVALDYREPHSSPELFELRRQRRSADDKR